MKSITRIGYVLPLAMAALFLTTSCDKEDEVKGPDKSGLLSANSWAPKSLTVNPAYDWFGDGNPITDIYAIFPPCSKDDFTTFRDNGAVVHDEGPSNCFEEGPQTKQGAWAFRNNETVIAVTEGGTTEEWAIVRLDTAELIVDFAVTEDNVEYTFTMAYRKK